MMSWNAWPLGASSPRRRTSTTIRLAPPLTITREDVDWAVDQLAAVLADLAAGRAAGAAEAAEAVTGGAVAAASDVEAVSGGVAAAGAVEVAVTGGAVAAILGEVGGVAAPAV